MWVHWWDVEREALIDGTKGQPGKAVMLRSEHHTVAPGGYEVFERVPKWFRGKTRKKLRIETGLQQWAESDPSVTMFWSEPWDLTGPKDERSIAEYQAFPVGTDPKDPTVRSFVIRCAELFIERETRTRDLHGTVKPKASIPAGKFEIGSIGGGGSRETQYRGSAPIDPIVDVELLQGSQLARHLNDVAGAFSIEDASFSPDTMTYFSGMPFDTADQPQTMEVGPTPIRLSVGIGESDNVQAAFAISMVNRETGKRSISDPTFLTSVRGAVIETDMPADMLSERSATALRALYVADGSLEGAAEEMGLPPDRALFMLEFATEELGADSLYDAAALVGLTNSEPEPVRVPVH